MKKYCFLILSAAAALLPLTGCSEDRTVTVIYTDVPSPLTTMTYSEYVPPDTYSQYMETYTSTSETGNEGYFHSLADTGLSVPRETGAGGGFVVGRDTALSRDSAVTEPPLLESSGGGYGEETVTVVTEVTAFGETAETSVTGGTAAPPDASAPISSPRVAPPEPPRVTPPKHTFTKPVMPEFPKADTAVSGGAVRDTALPRQTAGTETESSESGASD